MTETLRLQDRELFWPPADELTEAAERIRARLGDWQPTHAPWRICLTPPDAPNGGDLIIVTDAAPHLTHIARWMTDGAGVIEAAGENPKAARATLHLGGERYALEGELAEDWIPALAAFLDCGFDPHDALVLALAWRDGDEQQADAWPVDIKRFPRVLGLPAAPAQPFAPCPAKLGLYPVLPTADWVERVLDYGVKTVQLRSKQPKSPALMREIERTVWAVNGTVPLSTPQTLGEMFTKSMARTTFTLVLLSVAGAMALLLGIIGIYGVISYTVSQRTREIGIRMALGAERGTLTALFVRQGLALAVLGAVIGVGASIAAMRFMRSLLFNVSPMDPATYVVATVSIVAIAWLACYIPSRRAAAVNPVNALRAE